MNRSAAAAGRILLVLCLAAAAVLQARVAAAADDWPRQPVRVLVGFAAGGNIDHLARLTCARLSEAFGQQFVVENRVGAMGSLAADAVARSAGDGYSFFWAGTGTVSIFPAMSKTPYNTDKDFQPVGLIGTSPQVLVVNPDFPAKTLAEFIAAVKAKPGKLSYAGGGGPGSVSNLLMALFLKRAGLDMVAVSYRGTAPALTDIIAGHVPAMFVPLPEALAQAQGGKLRMIALSSAKRARQAPDVPSVAEFGLSRLRHRELERHAGAVRHAEADCRADRGRIRARSPRPGVRQAARQVWRRPARPRPGGVRRLPQAGPGAVGRSRQGRGRHAAVTGGAGQPASIARRPRTPRRLSCSHITPLMCWPPLRDRVLLSEVWRTRLRRNVSRTKASDNRKIRADALAASTRNVSVTSW